MAMASKSAGNRAANRCLRAAHVVALALLASVGATADRQTLAQTVPQILASPAQPTAVESRELHNVFQLSDRVFSGSEPESEAAFVELARLGVKTIVSVDGFGPRLEWAKRHGLRYIHIPIGYDGIPAQSALALARAARETKGMIYVHCHHGKHRGPAAAAILCRVDDGRTTTAAIAILERAGTGKEYPGLWRDVREFQIPAADLRLPELVESVQSPSLASSMAKIDRTYDALKQMASQRWRSPADSDSRQGSAPYPTSIQLREMLMESARMADQDELSKLLQESAAEVEKLSQTLKALESSKDAAGEGVGRSADERLMRIGQLCTQCHQKFRN